MKKSGWPTYLSKEKESLIVAPSDIEGENVQPLGISYL